EANAIANAAYQGIGLARSVCHVTHFPCASCAKLLVAAGVCAVYWAEEYRDTALAEKIFAEAAVATVRIGRWTAWDTREETGVQEEERYRTGAPAGRGLYCGSTFIALFEQAAVARRTAELYNDAYGLLSAEGYNPRETRLARAAAKAAEDAEQSRKN